MNQGLIALSNSDYAAALKVTVRRKLQDHPRLLGLCTSLYHRLKGRPD